MKLFVTLDCAITLLVWAAYGFTFLGFMMAVFIGLALAIKMTALFDVLASARVRQWFMGEI